MSERTYVLQTPTFSWFVYKGRLYYHRLLEENGRTREVLCSIHISRPQDEVQSHSSKRDSIPYDQLKRMQEYTALLRSKREQQVLRDLASRGVSHYRITGDLVEYFTLIREPNKEPRLAYDYYRTEFNGESWQLGTPYYWRRYVETKREGTGTFKLYSSTKGLYFKPSGTRIYLSEFTQLQ